MSFRVKGMKMSRATFKMLASKVLLMHKGMCSRFMFVKTNSFTMLRRQRYYKKKDFPMHLAMETH